MATKRFLVVGDPVHHSLSPLLHNSLYRLLELDAQYSALRLEKGTLGGLFARTDLSGFNLTMPHKQDVTAFLARTEPEGLLSVNTVKLAAEGAVGTSTDAGGFLRSLTESGANVTGARIALLGAGGAASSLARELLLSGCERVSIFNRTEQKALSLAKELACEGFHAEGFSLSGESLKLECSTADILINSTSCGMAGAMGFETLAFVDALPKSALVYDLVYRPVETPLLRAARRRGLKAQNGLGMLLYQGILAHEFWFGSKVPEFVARKVMELLEEAL